MPLWTNSALSIFCKKIYCWSTPLCLQISYPRRQQGPIILANARRRVRFHQLLRGSPLNSSRRSVGRCVPVCQKFFLKTCPNRGIYRAKPLFCRLSDCFKLPRVLPAYLSNLKRNQAMKQIVWMCIGLSVLLFSFSGCHLAGLAQTGQPVGQSNQAFNQVLSQGAAGILQQPLFGGAANSQTGGLNGIQQAQNSVGGFVREMGERISNGVVNRGINQFTDRLISGF